MLLTIIIPFRDAERKTAYWAVEESAADFRHELPADRLDAYYVAIGFEWPRAGLESKDALTRRKLRDVVRRCRKAKQK